MNGLREKFQNKKGFTLIEMLIVVAIIAILVAISIPLINNALERARDATDQANERAAKAEALLVYMGVSETDYTTLITAMKGTGVYYNAADGNLTATYSDIKAPYGKCTGCGETTRYPNAADHTKSVIYVKVNDTTSEPVFTIAWTASALT